MNDTVEKKTKRFLPAQLWIVFEIEDGDIKNYEVIKDQDAMMEKLMSPDFISTHRVVNVKRDELYA